MRTLELVLLKNLAIIISNLGLLSVLVVNLMQGETLSDNMILIFMMLSVVGVFSKTTDNELQKLENKPVAQYSVLSFMLLLMVGGVFMFCSEIECLIGSVA